MSNAFFKTPIAINEPVKAYAPGSAERNSLIQTYKDMWSQAPVDVPMYIGGKEILMIRIRRFFPALFSRILRKQSPF